MRHDGISPGWIKLYQIKLLAGRDYVATDYNPNFGKVHNVRQLNLNPDTMEAECFAWLAVRHTKGLPLTIPETTGCSRAVCGGMMTCTS